MIMYTHRAYFGDRDAAFRCAAALDALEFAVSVDASSMPEPGEKLLLRAAREVSTDKLVARHGAVEAIVLRHGGFYDGGGSGYDLPDRHLREV
jgi:hypothetical protein